MEFTVSKSDLVRELSLSQGVVEKKTTIPILSNVLRRSGWGPHRSDRHGSGAGHSLQLSGKGRPGRVQGLFRRASCSITSGLLPDADIQVKFGDNQWANLVCGRSRTRIAGMSRESFPELPEMPELLAEIPVGLLSSMISRTIFAISAEESRFTLNGALLMVQADGLDDGGDRRAPAGAGGGSRWNSAVDGTRLQALLPRRRCRRS